MVRNPSPSSNLPPPSVPTSPNPPPPKNVLEELATLMDAPTEWYKEDYVSGMGPSAKNAPFRDVPKM